MWFVSLPLRTHCVSNGELLEACASSAAVRLTGMRCMNLANKVTRYEACRGKWKLSRRHHFMTGCGALGIFDKKDGTWSYSPRSRLRGIFYHASLCRFVAWSRFVLSEGRCHHSVAETRLTDWRGSLKTWGCLNMLSKQSRAPDCEKVTVFWYWANSLEPAT
jgi:hypothetical protein